MTAEQLQRGKEIEGRLNQLRDTMPTKMWKVECLNNTNSTKTLVTFDCRFGNHSKADGGYSVQESTEFQKQIGAAADVFLMMVRKTFQDEIDKLEKDLAAL